MIKKLPLLICCLLAIPLSALSAPVTIDFTVTSTLGFDGDSDFNVTNYAAFPSGTIGGGSFTFDDSLAPFAEYNVGKPLINFDFHWLGASFDESVALFGSLTYDAAHNIDTWLIGTAGGYCARIRCISSEGPTDFWLSSESTGLESSIHIANYSGWMDGTLTWSVHGASVPEPNSVALIGLGLIGLFLARWKLGTRISQPAA